MNNTTARQGGMENHSLARDFKRVGIEPAVWRLAALLVVFGVQRVLAALPGIPDACVLFASQWRLSALIEDGRGVHAGLVARGSGESILLGLGQKTPDGAVLVSANCLAERALFQKGGEWFEVQMLGGEEPSRPAVAAAAPIAPTPRRADVIARQEAWATVPREEKRVFTIVADSPDAAGIQSFGLDGDSYLQVGKEILQAGPAVSGMGGITAIGTRSQMEAIGQLAGVAVTDAGPLAGYADICADQCAGASSDATLSGLDVATGYHDDEQVAALLEQFAAAYPERARRLALGTTHLGRTIWALKISAATDTTDTRPAVLFDGGIHANEYPGTEVCLDIVKELLANESNADYAQWLQKMDVYVVPLVNPDGRYLSYHMDTTWRKNARDNDGDGPPDVSSQPGNDGVDLNRNFPLGWADDDIQSSGEKYFNTYRGPGPASEPETQAMIKLMEAARPLMHLSFHTYYGAIVGPFNNRNIDQEIPEQIHLLGRDFAVRSDRGDGVAYEYLPGWDFMDNANGTMADWAFGEQAAMSYTVELGTRTMGHQPEYKTTREAVIPGIRPTWQRVLEAASRWLNAASDQKTGNNGSVQQEPGENTAAQEDLAGPL